MTIQGEVSLSGPDLTGIKVENTKSSSTTASLANWLHIYSSVFPSFCILTPTPGSCDSVVAALAHGDTSFSREVAQETGEEQGEERHGGPADAAVRLRAREGLVGTRVLVVAGAVVEKPLDATHARPVLHGALHRAHAPTAAHPARREHPRATAVRAAAPAAVLALVGVYTLIFRA